VRNVTRIAALVVGGALAVLLAPAVGTAWHSGSGQSQPVTVSVGDIVRVSGAPLGCAVRLYGGVTTLDCRRIGPLPGTYGTLLDATRVRVVRFESAKVAKVAFSATHLRERTHTCR
jgi:hypothetical protein